MDTSAFEAAAAADDELTFTEIFHRLPRGPKSVIEVTIFVGSGFTSFAAIIVTIVGCLTAYCLLLGWICIFWLTSQLLLKIAAFLRMCYEIEVPLTPASQRKSQSPRQHETWEEGREERLAVPIDDLATVSNRIGISEYVWPTASSEVKQSIFENLEYPPESPQDRSSALIPEHVETPRIESLVARSPVSSHGRRESMGHSLQSGDEQQQAQLSDKEVQQIIDFERSESQQAEVERLTGKREPQLKELMAHERARAKRERRTQMQEEEQTAWLERLKPRSPVRAKLPWSPSTSTARDIANPSPPTNHSTSGDAHHTRVSWGTKEALDAAASFSRDIKLAREAKKAYYIDNSIRTKGGNGKALKTPPAPQSINVAPNEASIPKLMNSRSVGRPITSQSPTSAQPTQDGSVKSTEISTLPPHLRTAAKKKLEQNEGVQDITRPLNSTLRPSSPNMEYFAENSNSVEVIELAKDIEQVASNNQLGDFERPFTQPAEDIEHVPRNIALEDVENAPTDDPPPRLSYDDMLSMDHAKWSAEVGVIADRGSPAAIIEYEPAPPVRHQPGRTMSRKQLKAFNTLPKKGSTHGAHTGDGLDAVEDHDADTRCTRCKRWTSSLYTSDADLCPPCLTIESRIDDALRIINGVAAGAISGTSSSRNKRSNARQDGPRHDREPKRPTTPVCWTCGMHHDGLCLDSFSDSASEMRDLNRPEVHLPGLFAQTLDDSDVNTEKQSNGTKVPDVPTPTVTRNAAKITSTLDVVEESPRRDGHEGFAQTREVFDHVSPSSTGHSSPATIESSSHRSSSLRLGPTPQMNSPLQQAVAALKAQAHQKRASLDKLNGALEQSLGEDRSLMYEASGGSNVSAFTPTRNAATSLDRLPESGNPFRDAHAVDDKSCETAHVRDANMRTSPEKQSSRSSSLNASAQRFQWKGTKPPKSQIVTDAPSSAQRSSLQVNVVPPTPLVQNIDWTALTEQWSDHSEIDPARNWTGWGYHNMAQAHPGDNPADLMHAAMQPLPYAARRASMAHSKTSSALPIVRPDKQASARRMSYDEAFPRLGSTTRTVTSASELGPQSGRRIASEETSSPSFQINTAPFWHPPTNAQATEYDHAFPPVQASIWAPAPLPSVKLPTLSKAIRIVDPIEDSSINKNSKHKEPRPVVTPPGFVRPQGATQGMFDALLADRKEDIQPEAVTSTTLDQRFRFPVKQNRVRKLSQPKNPPEEVGKRAVREYELQSTDESNGNSAPRQLIDAMNRDKGLDEESGSACVSDDHTSSSIDGCRASSGDLSLHSTDHLPAVPNGFGHENERDVDDRNAAVAQDKELPSTSDVEADSGKTVKKRRRQARAALREAWQQREQVRVRVHATHTLDGMRAFEEATKAYNDKRSALVACMASGELNEEDARVFPVFSRNDMAAPKFRIPNIDASSITQNDENSVPTTKPQNENKSPSPVTPKTDLEVLQDKALRARQLYENAYAYFDHPPPSGRAKIKDPRAQGEERIERAIRYYKRTKKQLEEAYGDERMPEWLRKELWMWDDEAMKKSRNQWMRKT